MSNSRSDGTDGIEPSAGDPRRPSDHVDGDGAITQPAIGVVGWLRWGWRQLTSMRTALVLLLLLAIAAVPGSMFPQQVADPNGVVQWERDNPDIFPFVKAIGMFDVYASPWFSAIYLLLFLSLIGCIIPRIRHHLTAMRSRPPRTPIRLQRLEAYVVEDVEAGEDADATAERAIVAASTQLRSSGYRVERYDGRGSFSVSAERGYARETGNLIFHAALVGVLVSVGVGGSVSYTGQTALIEGGTFVNALIDYTSMNKGRFVDGESLAPFAMTLDSFDVTYQPPESTAPGQAGDFAANVTIRMPDGTTHQDAVRVNHPLNVDGSNIYLLGNGYAPTISVRNAAGDVVFSQSVPFLPQDTSMFSMGVIKVPDGMPEQLGMIGLFYPTAFQHGEGAIASQYPDLLDPVLSLEVYEGDLGINDGSARSVYELQVDGMKQIVGREDDAEAKSIVLRPGESAQLPGGRGSVTFENQSQEVSGTLDSVKRFVSLQMHSDPTAVWVLVFAGLAFGGLFLALYVPRRRVWVKAVPTADGVRIEYAGLARGEDPQLLPAVEQIARTHQDGLQSPNVS